MTNDAPIYTVRDVVVTVEQRRSTGSAKTPAMVVSVPMETQAGNAELIVNQGGRSITFAMPWRELQRAEAVNLVFRDGNFEQAEVREAASAAPAVEKPRGARAWREADGSLRVVYDKAGT